MQKTQVDILVLVHFFIIIISECFCLLISIFTHKYIVGVLQLIPWSNQCTQITKKDGSVWATHCSVESNPASLLYLRHSETVVSTLCFIHQFHNFNFIKSATSQGSPVDQGGALFRTDSSFSCYFFLCVWVFFILIIYFHSDKVSWLRKVIKKNQKWQSFIKHFGNCQYWKMIIRWSYLFAGLVDISKCLLSAKSIILI